MHTSKGVYWCVIYSDGELLSEYGNAATFAEIVAWIADNLENLPKGEGSIVKKRVGK